MECKIFKHKENCKWCYNLSFISHPKSKFWSNNNKLKSFQVSKWSLKKFEFDCDICNHSFFIRPYHISKGFWCTICSGKKICLNNNCKQCFEKSFASHEKSKYWNYELNKITPREVFKYTNKKYNFICDKCSHNFQIILSCTSKSWCSYCSNKLLCQNNNCKICFNKSFASSEKCKYLISNINPRYNFKCSHRKYEFLCNKCDHSFICSLDQASRNYGWCPYCANQKLCSNNNCKICFNKSFASHKKSKWWNYELNKDIPREVFKKSNKKYNFICDKNHNFISRLRGITRHDFLFGCPKCKHKTEQKFYNWMLKKFPDIIHQYKPEWCKSNLTNKQLSFDFFIPSLNTIIEIDGPQHFRQFQNWTSPKYTQANDIYKMKLAIDRKISVIRIPYEYIYEEKHFCFLIYDIIQNLYRREDPKIILIVGSKTDDRYLYIENFDFLKEDIPILIPK